METRSHRNRKNDTSSSGGLNMSRDSSTDRCRHERFVDGHNYTPQREGPDYSHSPRFGSPSRNNSMLSSPERSSSPKSEENGNESNTSTLSSRSRYERNKDSSHHSLNESLLYPRLDTSTETDSKQFDSPRSLYPNLDISSTVKHRQTEKRLTAETNEKENVNINGRTPEFGILLFILLVICVIAFYVLYSIIQPADNTKVVHFSGHVNIPQRLGHFDESMKSIREKFPGQSTHLWKTVKSSVKSVLKTENPIRPSVVMFSVLKDIGEHEKLSYCLTKHIAESVSKSYVSNEPVFIKSEELISLSEDDAKLYLDNKLKSAFENNNVKVVVLHNIEEYQASLLFLLHAYCDNDNAPFRDVVFLITHFTGLKTNDLSIIEEDLQKIWASKLNDENEAGALSSRLSNNFVLIGNEDADVLTSNC